MKIPKSIKVGGKVYMVKFPYEFRETEILCGQSCHDINEIRVSGISPSSHKPRARENVEEVFIHELLHSVDCVYNALKLSKDEEQLDRLAQGLYQVLKDADMLKD